MMSSARVQIEATVEQFGWVSTRLTDDWYEYVKPVPMISQRDEYRVVVLFHPSGRVAQAYYGADDRSKTFRLPLRTAIIDHLMEWGPHHA